MSQVFTIIDWQNGEVILLDQRRLPEEEVHVHCRHPEELAAAIRNMTVRGAPAIGVAAALGLALVAQNSRTSDFQEFSREIEDTSVLLLKTRPTAVNLRWALDKMRSFLSDNKNLPMPELKQSVILEAIKIKEDDITTNKRMGEIGQQLLEDGDTVMTICNAGALCSAGFGTALGVIYAARQHGKNIKVIACETRPFLQGARLTSWELSKNNVPVTVITDNMAGHVMQRGLVQKIITGADRIAANGDTANKIGTYGLAVLARYHNLPFYVAAPTSTIDLNTAHGGLIPIEERPADEIRHFNGKTLVADKAQVLHPAFDVTPHELITAIITDREILRNNLLTY